MKLNERPQSTFHNTLLAVVAVLSIGILIASGETSGTSDSGESAESNSDVTQAETSPSSETDDVKLTSCGADSLGYLQAELTVTNNSSKESDYIINVVFESDDGSTQLDTAISFVNNLKPGQNKVEKALSFTEAPANFTCTISSVDRSESL